MPSLSWMSSTTQRQGRLKTPQWKFSGAHFRADCILCIQETLAIEDWGGLCNSTRFKTQLKESKLNHSFMERRLLSLVLTRGFPLKHLVWVAVRGSMLMKQHSLIQHGNCCVHEHNILFCRTINQQLAVQPRVNADCSSPGSQRDHFIWQRLWRKLLTGEKMLRSQNCQQDRQGRGLVSRAHAGKSY